MPGVFNTIDHETEGISRQASEALMHALSKVLQMLAHLEANRTDQAEVTRAEAVRDVDRAAQLLHDVADRAGTYRLSIPGQGHPEDEELRTLYQTMEAFGYPPPLRNSDLPRIGAQEARALHERLDHGSLGGSNYDVWQSTRDVLSHVQRILSIGVAAARLSALHGHP